jgi:phosphoribosylformimino-5-aminoimidazole carboxamide ribotide isomerase
MRIIPAIDIIDGKCVRLSQGDYDRKKIYNEHPLEVAKEFEDAGIQYLHLVDLDGAKEGKVVNWKVLESIAKHTNLTIDVGGGIKTEEDLRVVLGCGVKQANIGSLAVSKPDVVMEWIQRYGADVIILSADVKGTKVAVSGWQEDSGIELNDLLGQYAAVGLRYVVCTDIAKDGMLQGPSIDLYKKLLADFSSLHVVASGGVSCIGDVELLNNTGVDGVIIGKAFYEGRIKMSDLSRFLGQISQ